MRSRQAKPSPCLRDNIALCDARLNFADDGRHFRCDFIREGPVYFQTHGIEVLRRGTIEAALESYVGKPLVIEHISPSIDVADASKFVRHGTIEKAGFDKESGWFFCEGVVDTEEGKRAALELNPSCGYRVNAKDDRPCRWNNIPYARELTQIEFHHLALTKIRPRYEEADFRLNAVENQTGAPTMFKFLKKFIPTGAPAGTVPTVEEIEIPADTTIKLANGQEVRLCSVIEEHEKAAQETPEAKEAREKKAKEEADAAAARVNAVTDETEVIVAGKPVKVGDLRRDHEARLNAAEAEKKQGAQDFKKLQAAAAGTPAIRTDYAQTAGTLAEGLKRGKY